MHLARISLFSRNNDWYFLLNNNGQFMWLLVILWGHYATPGHINTGVTQVWPLSPLPAPSGTNTGSHCFINIFRSTNTFSRVVVSFVKISPAAANKNTMGNIKTSFHAAICINLYKSSRRLMWPCLVKRHAKAKSIPYIPPPLRSPRTFCFLWR